MRRSLPTTLLLTTLAATTISAHIMVSPPKAKAGATQRYELRVHNEATVAVTAVDLQIPDGVTVTDVAKPAAGSYTTQKAAGRIAGISWRIDVAPGKYVALPFTATNPDRETDLHWNVREHLADGSTVEWSDKPGAKEKASMTRLVARSGATYDGVRKSSSSW